MRFLTRFPLLRTQSVDEARECYSRLHVPVWIDPVGRARGFYWNANRVAVDRVAALVTEYGQAIDVTSETSGTGYQLGFAARGHAEFTQGDRTATLDAGGGAVMISPSTAVSCKIDRAYQGVQIMIPGPTLERTFAALVGLDVTKPLTFDIALGRGSRTRSTLARLVHFFLHEADRQSNILMWPIVASNLVETLLHAIVVGWPHRLSQQLQRRSRPAEPSYLRRAEEYLAANAHRAITGAELALRTGVSMRSIQGAFRLYRDSTPSAFLRSRRFELARHRLLTTPACTVTEVAFGCGFDPRIVMPHDIMLLTVHFRQRTNAIFSAYTAHLWMQPSSRRELHFLVLCGNRLAM